MDGGFAFHQRRSAMTAVRNRFGCALMVETYLSGMKARNGDFRVCRVQGESGWSETH
jgi:hypothetical protein